MATERETYNDQFADNQWAHYLIRRVNLSKSRDAQLAVLKNTGIKKKPLVGVITYLKNSFTNYPDAVSELNPKKAGTTMMEFFSQLLKFVELTLPHNCLKCKTEYFPYTQDRSGSEVSCAKCNLPAHGACIKDEAVNVEWGIVFICDICSLSQKKPMTDIPETVDKPPQTSGTDSDSSDETSKKKKKLSKTRNSPKPNHHDDESEGESKDSDSDSDKQQKMCSYFKQGTCRYGASGRSGGVCKFIHRKVCTPYRLYGESRKGCKKKEECEFWHPPLCYKSVNDRECLNERCRFWHLKGTVREQANLQSESNQNYEGQTSYHTNRANAQQYARPMQQQYNPQRYSNTPVANYQGPPMNNYQGPPVNNYQGPPVNNYQGQPVNGGFLGQMREHINKEMAEIRKQQDIFMTRLSQQMQTQIQQLLRPNVASQDNQTNHVQPVPQMQYHQAYPQMQQGSG